MWKVQLPVTNSVYSKLVLNSTFSTINNNNNPMCDKSMNMEP